jgi:PAS domain S-box-containing protein
LLRKSNKNDLKRLRAEAEARVARAPVATAGRLPSSNLAHELQVQQVELEMQIEELQRTKVDLEGARDRYVDLYDFAPVGYLTLSTAGVIQEANLTAAGLLNEDRKTLIGRPFAAFAGGDGDKWHLFFSAVVRRGESLACDLALQRSDGSAFDGHVACDYRVTGDAGPSVRIVLTDVTEHKRAEAQRLNALQAAIEGLPIGVTAGGETPDGVLTLTNWNSAFEEIVGAPLAPGPFTSLPIRTYLPDRTTVVPVEELPGPRAARTGRVIRNVELHIQRPDGEWEVVLMSAAPLGGRAGVARHAVAVVLDITDRRRAEDALRKSEAHFRQLVTALPMPVAFSNSRGEIVTINEKFTQVLGYTLDDIPTVDGWFQRAYPDETYRRCVVEAWTRLVDEATKKHGEVAPRDYRVTCKDGTVRTMSISAVRIGENLLVTMLDLTDRRRAEDALRTSEARYRSVVASMAEGVVVRNADGTVAACNEAAERILGLSEAEMRERPVPDPAWNGIREDGTAMPPGDHPALAALRTGQPQLHVVSGLRTADGSATWILSNSEPLFDPGGRVQGVATTMSDITEPRALRQQLAVSSRLAAMGTLVAGVGHEINNPLVAVLAGQAVALEAVREVQKRFSSVPPGDLNEVLRDLGDAVEALTDAQEGGLRVARIVKDLTVFGRADPKRTRVRLIDIVDGAMRWLAPDLKGGADIAVEVQEAPDVFVSLGHVERAVVNLLTNAVMATPKGQRGKVVVRIGPGAPGMARIELIDRGVGIPPAIKDRLFEPFFTTREVGKGQGLGLAVAHAIATAYGGTITVESEVGKGSTFRLELPAAPVEA